MRTMILSRLSVAWVVFMLVLVLASWAGQWTVG